MIGKAPEGKEALYLMLEDEGYIRLREWDGRTIGILPLMFTWGLMIDLNKVGYEFRYCFKTLQDAIPAFEAFGGYRDPEDFIIRKGFGKDYNPNDEFNKGLPLLEQVKAFSEELLQDDPDYREFMLELEDMMRSQENGSQVDH